MAEYLRPDVYVAEMSTNEKPNQTASTSTGAFIGVTARGVVGKPVLITSWTEFIENFALGLDSPFLKDSYLPNAVYGFFQNGGSQCYVVRVASASARVSKCILTPGDLEIQAREVGSWANNTLKLKSVEAEGGDLFTINVYMKDELVEVLEDLSNDVDSNNYFVDVINETSKFLYVDPETSESLGATSGVEVFTTGDDSTISNDVYLGENGIKALDNILDVNLVAIPGKTEDEVVKGLLSYCDNRNSCFAILEAPQGSTIEDVKTFRKKLKGRNGSLMYPWGKIVDPLGRSNKTLKACPPCGHVMGLYAKTDSKRGIYKEPAGEEFTLKGFVDLETEIPLAEMGALNTISVNCIINKVNKGILVWGARSLSTDKKERYVSDVRFKLMLNSVLTEDTKWAVFEPNNEILWAKLDTHLRGYLDNLWREGALKGSTEDQAYYVKCDKELNTSAVVDEGQVIAEIGYAKQKPAEFVTIKIIHKSV